jgi:hypothetical protein
MVRTLKREKAFERGRRKNGAGVLGLLAGYWLVYAHLARPRGDTGQLPPRRGTTLLVSQVRVDVHPDLGKEAIAHAAIQSRFRFTQSHPTKPSI